MISLGLSTGAWFDMLTVVYVYVLSDTLHFILLEMVLRDRAVNINSTLTERRIQTRWNYSEKYK